MTSFFSDMFYKLIASLTDINVVPSARDFHVMRRYVVDKNGDPLYRTDAYPFLELRDVHSRKVTTGGTTNDDREFYRETRMESSLQLLHVESVASIYLAMQQIVCAR